MSAFQCANSAAAQERKKWDPPVNDLAAVGTVDVASPSQALLDAQGVSSETIVVNRQGSSSEQLVGSGSKPRPRWGEKHVDFFPVPVGTGALSSSAPLVPDSTDEESVRATPTSPDVDLNMTLPGVSNVARLHPAAAFAPDDHGAVYTEIDQVHPALIGLVVISTPDELEEIKEEEEDLEYAVMLNTMKSLVVAKAEEVEVKDPVVEANVEDLVSDEGMLSYHTALTDQVTDEGEDSFFEEDETESSEDEEPDLAVR